MCRGKRIHLPFPVLKSGLNPVEELAGVFRGGERPGLPSTSSLLDRSKSAEYNERVITDSDYLECYYPKHAGLWSLSDYPRGGLIVSLETAERHAKNNFLMVEFHVSDKGLVKD
nr:hypothetical protein Q903MT_gene6001 [Picea sitchensis]